LPASNYEWWNKSWTLRIPVGLTAVGYQQNAPVELTVNFTRFFNDLNVQNPILNVSSVRVIEYQSISTFYEVESQFDPYPRSYDNVSNAIGDLIWILNGTTNHGVTRDFFVYFNNGSSSEVLDPNYDTIRIWHEGFEDFQISDLLRPTDGQDNYNPNSWEISNTTKARGNSALKIWGNCWKASATGTININSDTRVTAKMRFDDPTLLREISGLGFRVGYTSIPASGNSYNIRGNQAWGSAGSYKFRNQYYQDNTFFWYTFELDSETSLTSFDHIFYEADDDSYSNLDLYWDDISIWAKPVQTTPNNSLQAEFGAVQPISFTLKLTCKDEEGNPVQNAHIFISNDVSPTLNQDNYTDENGEWIFTNIAQNGLYNITINYTQNGLSNPKIETVDYYENFPITILSSYLNAYLNLTTLNFNVSDRDSAPIDFGYVLLKEGAETVGKAILSNDGTGTIIWINNTAYDYEVYYDYDSLPDTSNYRYSSLLINSSSVGALHDFDVLTEISKIVFNVTDDTPGKIPFTNAKLRFFNETDYSNENLIIANVSADIDGIARFVSFSNTTGAWGDYTVDIYFGGALRDFHAGAAGLESHYNFSLSTEAQVSIRIPLDKNDYNSTIEIIDITSDVIWGDDINVQFNFTKQDPSNSTSTLVTPNELFVQVYDEELTVYSQEVGILSYEIAVGVFNYTFNTDTFHLIGGSVYYIEFTGNYKSYVFNTIQPSQIRIASKTAGIKFFNYSLVELTNKRISTVYLEPVNITVDYFDNNTNISLPGADLSYSWDYGAGVLNNDPLHSGKYYFEFDSSLAPSDADYVIDITAFLLNHSLIEETLLISIVARPTSINGTTTLFQSSPNIYVVTSAFYSFVYRDVLNDVLIGDLDVASYNWYKLDEEGNPLSGPENEGMGILTEGPSKNYILDLDTELKEVGEYTIFITLQKNNYEVRNAFISLSIMDRPIDVALDATGLSGKRIDVVQGTNIDFQVILTDPSNTDQLLTGVTVFLRIGHSNYTMNETTNGVYKYRYSTANIDAFMSSQTLDETYITIEKENYEDQTIEITIVVGMTEIFPGFPMFYFLLIIIGIVAVVGSLVSYRQIQRARIPTFIKKTRSMKSTIKSRKSISESLLYPSKESYIVKQLGDKWETIGLSLENILGIEPKKGKKSLEKSNNEGGVM
ncbi:MAG: hypothetical protein ACTSPU_02565, partial [Promethearchaeota archaeon]